MANVSGSIQVSVAATQVVTSGLVSTQNLPASITQALNYSSGTGAGQVNLCYAKALTLNATPTTLDLTSILALDGSTVNFARVRELFVMNLASAGGQVLTVGSSGGVGSAFSAFQGASGTTVVHPAITSSVASATMLRWSDPSNVGASSGAVTGASNKNVKLDPGANSITVQVVILGCDAVS